MLKKIILLVFVDIFILFLIVTCLFTGVHHNAIYNKYIDDVMDIKAVVESVREESDGEDSEYHVYARYEYNGTLYRGYVGSFTSKYEEGDLIELKVFKDDPSLLFNVDNGIWGVFGGMLFYFILIWLSWIMIQDILYKSKKKEISSKHIYMAIKSSDTITAAMLFTMLTFIRVMQIWLYPQLLKTGIDVWINSILAAVTVILWVVLIAKVRNLSVSKYTITTDVCLDKYKDEMEEAQTIGRTVFYCGKSKNPRVYENVEKGQSCYVLTNPKGKILAAYDIAKWGSPSFTANDFDYKREYCKELFSALLFSAIAALAFTALIAVARASITL